ncbi:MAG: restriction endonuclease subunit S [Verrucomicrobia bacterium]|nr:restriction endonuclease subunit S [Verrucomicrobiota bacterium]
MISHSRPQTQVGELIRRGVLALNDGYRVRNAELGPIGIPFVRGGDIGDGDISTAVEDHIRPEFADRVRSKLTQAYDVAFITKGTVGRVGMMRPGQPVSVFAPQVCYWRSLDREQLEPRFLFYLLKSAEFQSNLDAVKTHGAMVADYVSLSDQRLFKLTFPLIAEQKAIAAVLGALDDKIELNRRMNATLEAMARALFQSWFVDFDPVRAKLDGRQPAGLDKATAALFPEHFEETALGPIPKGWRIKRIEEVAERVAMGPFGSSIKVSTFVPEGIPVISGQHLHEMMLNDSEFNFVTHQHADQLQRSNVQRGDVIFTHAGSIGQVALIPESSRFTRYVISQRQFYMRCDRAQISPFYVVLYFKTPDGQHRLLANTSSTGVPSIAQPVTYLRQLQLVIPPPPLLARFDEIVGAWMRQVAANLHESRTLATLRDTLLPKLLSGKVSVGHVSKEVSA